MALVGIVQQPGSGLPASAPSSRGRRHSTPIATNETTTAAAAAFIAAAVQGTVTGDAVVITEDRAAFLAALGGGGTLGAGRQGERRRGRRPRRRATQNHLQTSRPRRGDRSVPPPPLHRGPTSPGRETSIVAALRALLAAKDDEIRRLKTKVHEHESTMFVGGSGLPRTAVTGIPTTPNGGILGVTNHLVRLSGGHVAALRRETGPRLD